MYKINKAELLWIKYKKAGRGGDSRITSHAAFTHRSPCSSLWGALKYPVSAKHSSQITGLDDRWATIWLLHPVIYDAPQTSGLGVCVDGLQQMQVLGSGSYKWCQGPSSCSS